MKRFIKDLIVVWVLTNIFWVIIVIMLISNSIPNASGKMSQQQNFSNQIQSQQYTTGN